MALQETKRVKTAQVNLRLLPEMKVAAEKAASADRRSLTSLIEKLLDEHLKAHGYLTGADTIAPPPPEPEDTARKIAERRSAATQGRKSAERARKRAGVKPMPE